jgi:hypothetical protein
MPFRLRVLSTGTVARCRASKDLRGAYAGTEHWRRALTHSTGAEYWREVLAQSYHHSMAYDGNTVVNAS